MTQAQMPKRLLCVFAHPDDEALGPGGTIALWSRNGAEIHLLCATKGQAGINPTSRNIEVVREEELRKSAAILGIQAVSFLDFKDGCICNNEMLQLEEKIAEKIQSFQPDALLTFALDGVSGHLDHIAVASSTTQAFKKTGIPRILYYYTERKVFTDRMPDYFILFPKGKTKDQVDLVNDISEVWATCVKAMYAHESQTKDLSWIYPILESLDKEEYFLIRKQPSHSP
ncbi:MAG: PIG-L family deacetylase [Candidatus Levybacteria bacterium]|nr:PIG-L family deacetylase [Candidatus Levybacteria bacterium]